MLAVRSRTRETPNGNCRPDAQVPHSQFAALKKARHNSEPAGAPHLPVAQLINLSVRISFFASRPARSIVLGQHFVARSGCESKWLSFARAALLIAE